MRFLSSCCLSHKDEAILKSLISLLEGKTRQSWTYNRGTNGDVVIIDLDEPDGRATWEQVRRENRHSVPIAYTAADHAGGEALVLPKPLRARDLVELLNKVNVSAQSGEAKAAAVPPASAQSTPPPDAKTQRLFEFLQRVPPRPLRISKDDRALIIDGSAQRYASSHRLAELNAMFATSMSELSLVPLAAVPTAELDWKPLHQLVWYGVLHGSGGERSPAISADGVLRLKRWPNFGVLAHVQEHYKLAAFMTRHVESADRIAAATGVALEQTIDFINACHACGYLHITSGTRPQQASNENRVDNKKRGLLQMIRGRLGLLQQASA